MVLKKTSLRKKYFFLALSFLILYATAQFLLILRHKSPFLSDSYYYMHLVYEFKGDSYKVAKEKTLSQINLRSLDPITKNIFFGAIYDDTYGFFSKRPFYPFLAAQLNRFFNMNLSMLLPIYLSYLGIIIVTFNLLSKSMRTFWALLATFMFISFYPFLDWSTYFLTDTISAFLWMLIIFLIFNILTRRKKLLMLVAILSTSSLLIREQNILLAPFIIIMFVIVKFKNMSEAKYFANIIILFTLITITYTILSLRFIENNLFKTLTYTMNDYGFNSYSFSNKDVVKYLVNTNLRSQTSLLKELVSHHLWLLALSFGILGFVHKYKTMNILDALMFSSAVASYLAIFIYPVLSYRYFFPVVIAVCYFSTIFLKSISKINYNQAKD